MAMFLSRLKQVLNLGTKSITANGTYTASSDGYDGYSSVSVNVPSVTPTSITPSNSNPAALTSGSAVTPSANGYAIESYSSVTPSSTQVAVSANDIVKIGGNGVIVDSVPTPTSITPSNSNPPTLSADTPVNPTASGYAVSTYDIRYPQSIPASVTGGEVYYMRGNGYVISGYTTVTPSDTTPPELDNMYMYKPSSAGYLYASSGLKKVKTGSVSLTANTTNTITCGFEPKYIAYSIGTGNMSIYDSSVSTTQYKKGGSSGITNRNIGQTSSYDLYAVTSTGFQVRGASSAMTCNYFAIG